MEKKIKITTVKGEKTISFEKHLANLIIMIEAMSKSVNDHYQKTGLRFVEVPEMVGVTGACENIDTLFKIGNRLDLPLFITQTGQLSLEQSLQVFPGVFTVIHSGRDEEIEDNRHLRQFRLTEEEFDCTLAGMTRKTYQEEKMYQQLLSHIELAIKAMIKGAFEAITKELEKDYGQSKEVFKEVLSQPFLRINYEEAIALINKNGHFNLKFGDDLKAEHEEMVINLVNAANKNGRKAKLPVFVMRYPKEIKFFNMKVSEADKRVVLSADLIFPESGEAVGSAVREHRGDFLKERLLTSNMFRLHRERGGKYTDFSWYVDDIISQNKTNPHAGYGIGNERVIQYILGQKDIRICSIFSLLNRQTGDWDKERHGGLLLFASKKAILLSIGRTENKRKLLPFIKQIYNKNTTLYATEKTHKFLEENEIATALVYKISQEGKPNLIDLLNKNIFDVIINIPTRDGTIELTDGKLIRKAAIESGALLITDMEVAVEFLSKFSQRVK